MLPGLLPLLPLSSVEQPPPHPTLTPTTTTTTLSYPHATTTFSLYHNCYSWKEMYSRLSSVYTCNSKAYWVYCSTFIWIIITFLNQTLDFGRLRNLQKNKKRYVWTDDALGDARFKIKTPFLHLKTDSVKKIRLTLNFSVVYGNVNFVNIFFISFFLVIIHPPLSGEVYLQMFSVMSFRVLFADWSVNLTGSPHILSLLFLWIALMTPHGWNGFMLPIKKFKGVYSSVSAGNPYTCLRARLLFIIGNEVNLYYV